MPERHSQLDIPVSARWLHVAANFIRAAAEGAGFDEDAIEAIEIASMEAVENVIDHSKLGGGDRLQIDAAIDGRDFVVQIRDRGIPWPNAVIAGQVGYDMPPPDAPRGRGIAMMRALMDEVTPWQGTDGEKVLRMVKRGPNADTAGASAHA